MSLLEGRNQISQAALTTPDPLMPGNSSWTWVRFSSDALERLAALGGSWGGRREHSQEEHPLVSLWPSLEWSPIEGFTGGWKYGKPTSLS